MTVSRVRSTDTIPADVCCSFCGNEPDDISRLIAGPDVFICDECIAAGSDLLAAEEAPGSDDAADAEADTESIDDQPPVVKPVFFRLVNGALAAGLLSMDDLIDEMEGALKRFSSGEVAQPVRTVIPIGDHGGLFGLMPASAREPAVVGAKLITVFEGNRAIGLPSHLGAILLFSPRTGALVAMVDGHSVTEARTAAVSAVSARVLARDEASVMAIIGSGAQARSHLAALERVFELSEVRVFSPTADHQAAFITEMEATTKTRLIGTDSAGQAVAGADLVVLVTSSSEPVVKNEWIKSGAHVIGVGACRPHQREMDPVLVRRGRLFVDSRAAALVEAGDIVLGIAQGELAASHIIGELGEVLAGKVEGRRSPRDVTIFKSLGLAVEDVVAADLIYRRAVEQDVGVELEL